MPQSPLFFVLLLFLFFTLFYIAKLSRSAGFAGLLIPGLGHIIQKRYWHALILGSCIYGIFGLGMLFSSGSAIDLENHEIYWTLQLLNGLIAWVFSFDFMQIEARLGENVSILGHSMGMLYTAFSGLLNFLALLELAKHQDSFTNEPDKQKDT